MIGWIKHSSHTYAVGPLNVSILCTILNVRFLGRCGCSFENFWGCFLLYNVYNSTQERLTQVTAVLRDEKTYPNNSRHTQKHSHQKEKTLSIQTEEEKRGGGLFGPRQEGTHSLYTLDWTKRKN